MNPTKSLISQVRNTSTVFKSDRLSGLVSLILPRRLVLMGESTHGTHEFYDLRMKISRHLIEDQGFSFIAVEGDWPDCYHINRYVKNIPGSGQSALFFFPKPPRNFSYRSLISI